MPERTERTIFEAVYKTLEQRGKIMTSKYALTGISMLFVLTALTACGGGGGGGAAPAAPAPNPTFTAQPTSTTVTAPNTATFTVIAIGTPTPTLQWQLSTNGGGTFADIPGATASSYTTPATVIGDSGKQYRAVATNSAGTVNSNAATLTVNQTPAFTTQPTSVTVTAPATAAFNVVATGTPTPTLQWQLSTNGGGTWGNIVGATTSSYTTPATVIGDSGNQYRAVATNSAGTVNSNAATLVVQSIPVFTTQPISDSVIVANTATFNATTTGTPTPTLQWQLSTNGGSSFANIAGATSSSYTTPVTVIGDSGKQYRVVATNSLGTVISNAATLTVVQPLALPETGQTLCYDVTGFAIACAGTGQDGELRAGVAWPVPRFVVGTGVGTTDQCVTDSLTGLMWVRSPSTIPVNWATALTSANDLTLCGFSDWRLPNRKELRSLIDYSLTNNFTTLNTLGFTGVQALSYWSSSSYAGNAAGAWFVSMLDGYVYVSNKSGSSYVWPVRAGQ